MAGYRREFDRQMDAIDVKVIELFAIVGEDLPGVTQALLTGSNDGAGQLAEREQAIDSLYREIELLASREILLQAPVASDLRFLLTVLRVAPELERSHDLECQIASRAGHSLAAGLSPRCRGLIEQMSELASSMWRRAADCWYQRDGSAAPALAKLGDEMEGRDVAIPPGTAPVQPPHLAGPGFGAAPLPVQPAELVPAQPPVLVGPRPAAADPPVVPGASMTGAPPLARRVLLTQASSPAPCPHTTRLIPSRPTQPRCQVTGKQHAQAVRRWRLTRGRARRAEDGDG